MSEQILFVPRLQIIDALSLLCNNLFDPNAEAEEREKQAKIEEKKKKEEEDKKRKEKRKERKNETQKSPEQKQVENTKDEKEQNNKEEPKKIEPATKRKLIITPRLVLLHGMAGNGKTTIAKRMVSEIQNQDKQTKIFKQIIWLHVGEKTILHVLEEIATIHKCPHLSSFDLYKEYFGRTKIEPTLFILDDVQKKDITQKLNEVFDYSMHRTSIQFLVTSEDESVVDFKLSKRVHIGEMTELEAASLFIMKAGLIQSNSLIVDDVTDKPRVIRINSEAQPPVDTPALVQSNSYPMISTSHSLPHSQQIEYKYNKISLQSEEMKCLATRENEDDTSEQNKSIDNVFSVIKAISKRCHNSPLALSVVSGFLPSNIAKHKIYQEIDTLFRSIQSSGNDKDYLGVLKRCIGLLGESSDLYKLFLLFSIFPRGGDIPQVLLERWMSSPSVAELLGKRFQSNEIKNYLDSLCKKSLLSMRMAQYHKHIYGEGSSNKIDVKTFSIHSSLHTCVRLIVNKGEELKGGDIGEIDCHHECLKKYHNSFVATCIEKFMSNPMNYFSPDQQTGEYLLTHFGEHCHAAVRKELILGCLFSIEWLYCFCVHTSVTCIDNLIERCRKHLYCDNTNVLNELKILQNIFQKCSQDISRSPFHIFHHFKERFDVLKKKKVLDASSETKFQQMTNFDEKKLDDQLKCCRIQFNASEGFSSIRGAMKGSFSMPSVITAVLVFDRKFKYYALVGDKAGTLHLWNLKTIMHEYEFHGHTGAINGIEHVEVKFDKNMKPIIRKFISWSDDDSVILWDLDNKHLKEVYSAAGSVKGVKLFRDYCRILVWDNTGSLIILDVRSLCITSPPRRFGHLFPINGAMLFNQEKKVITWGTLDKCIKVWDIKSRVKASEGSCYEGHTKDITGVIVLKGDKYAVSWSQDYTLRLWDMEKKKESICVFEGHGDWVCEALQLDERRILSWGHDGQVIIWGDWDLNNPDSKKNYKFVKFQAHGTGVGCPVIGGMLLEGNMKFLSWGFEGHIKLWKIEIDGKTYNLRKVRAYDDGHRGPVNGVKLVEMGAQKKSKKLLSWGADSNLISWEFESAQPNIFRGHSNSVNDVTIINETEQIVISSGNDGNAIVWCTNDTNEDFHGFHKSWVSGKKILKDGRILTWSVDGSIILWNLKDILHPLKCEEQDKTKGLNLPIKGVCIFSDEKRVVSYGEGPNIIIWNIEEKSNQPKYEVLQAKIDEKTELNYVVNGIILFAKDTKLLAWNTAGVIFLWDLSQKKVNEIPTGGDALPGTVTEYTNVKWEKVHDKPVVGMRLLEDEKMAFSWSDDCLLILWDVSKGEPEHTFEVHQGGVIGFTTLPGEQKAFTWSSDNHIVIYDLTKLKSKPIIVEGIHQRTVNGVIPLPNGKYFSYGCDNMIVLWKMEEITEEITGEITGEVTRESRKTKIADTISVRPRHHKFTGHTDWVTDFKIVGEITGISLSYDGTVRVWDLRYPDKDDQHAKPVVYRGWNYFEVDEKKNEMYLLRQGGGIGIVTNVTELTDHKLHSVSYGDMSFTQLYVLDSVSTVPSKPNTTTKPNKKNTTTKQNKIERQIFAVGPNSVLLFNWTIFNRCE